jgi:hypothetical protein
MVGRQLTRTVDVLPVPLTVNGRKTYVLVRKYFVCLASSSCSDAPWQSPKDFLECSGDGRLFGDIQDNRRRHHWTTKPCSSRRRQGMLCCLLFESSFGAPSGLSLPPWLNGVPPRPRRRSDEDDQHRPRNDIISSANAPEGRAPLFKLAPGDTCFGHSKIPAENGHYNGDTTPAHDPCRKARNSLVGPTGSERVQRTK